ncbi:MAG TPA: ABC transporter permease [Solirubrobacteraceae bacterium]|jgi:osmoprotectant transport system permease protein|nr:ABC transporter permease [Solirubrobacteraceae bacterium]
MNDFTRALDFIGTHQSLLWHKTGAHMAISGAAIGIAVLVAVPLGLWLGHLHRWSFLAINVANIGRALPSLAIISIGLGVLGLGFWNVVVALVVLAVPIMITNAYLAIDQVDADIVEAARGVGMTGWQVFRLIELPLGVALLFAGIRTATLYVIATATLGSVAGASGLGDIIVNQASYRFEGVLGAALWVAALALLADLALGAVQQAVTPRGVRPDRVVRPGAARADADPRTKIAGVPAPSTRLQ